MWRRNHQLRCMKPFSLLIDDHKINAGPFPATSFDVLKVNCYCFEHVLPHQQGLSGSS